MRKALSLAALATVTLIATAVPAFANLVSPTPANGSTVSGTLTLKDDGSGSAGINLVLGSCNGVTTITVTNSANATVASGSVTGSGGQGAPIPLTITWITDNVPNGAYKITGSNKKYANLCITNSTSTTTSNVTVQNIGSISYGGASSAPTGTSATVKATFTDANGVAPATGTTVTFALGGQAGTATAVTNAQGVAQTTLAVTGAPRSVNLTASTVNGFYTAASTSVPFTVQADPTTTALTSTLNPSTFGQSVGFHAAVTSTISGLGTPTGTVQFVVDGTSFGSAVALVGGAADSTATTALGAGPHSVQAVYTPSGSWATSTGNLTQTVNKASTTTSVTSSVNPSVFGQGVTYSAHVAVVAPGAGTPTGTVTFTADGTPIGSPVAIDTSGNATSDPIASLVVGDHAISAVYSGDVPFAGSSDALTQTVNKAATTTNLDTSVSPSVFGQDVTFTATLAVVSPGAGTPTGSVDFFDGTTLLGAVPVTQAAGAGSAQLTTNGLSVGSHAISAVYSGDGSFTGSTGSTTQAVNKASSTTTITQNGPIVQGQPVTFSASVAFVAPGAGTPTGTVQFKLNGAAQGTPVALDGSGNATSAPITGLTPGGYTITAVYSGDGNLLPSTGTIGQNVNPASTSITLHSSGSPSSYGSSVTLLATVDIQAGAVGTPTGTVDFYDGGTLLGASDLVDNGGGPQASISVSNLAVGHHALTAQYLGEADFAGSTSNTVDQAVNGDPTTIAVVSLGNPTVYHSPVTFRATVTPTVANPNAVTGLVTFYDGTTVIGASSVSGAGGTGTASITVSNLGAGSHTIKAQYSGDGNFGNSTSSTITQTVTKQATSLTASITTSKTITATLTSAADGPLAGRTLVFKSGSTTMCTATTNASGVAVCNAGSFSLQITINGYQVSFAGDANYGSSSFSGH